MCAQYLLLWEPVPAAEYESLDLSGPVASRTVHALPQSWSSEFSAYLQSSFGYYRAVRAPKLCFVAICDGVLQSFTYVQHVTLRHDAYIQGPQEAGLTKLLVRREHVFSLPPLSWPDSVSRFSYWSHMYAVALLLQITKLTLSTTNKFCSARRRARLTTHLTACGSSI